MRLDKNKFFIKLIECLRSIFIKKNIEIINEQIERMIIPSSSSDKLLEI